MECSTACTPPIDTGEDNVSINGKHFNQINGLTMQHHCSGSGDWPGIGGCYFCKRTVLNLEPKDSHHHLKCVNSCPFGTYLHVINLHHRGGSSVYPQSTVNLHMKKKGINESTETTTTTPTTTKTTDLLFTHFPWSQTDAGLFHKFSTKIIEELANWLVNHTQPKLYGLAQICLPCNEQCYKEMSISMRKSIHQIGLSSVACYGPSPEQCVRCANANYQGRCVSACPIGTFPQKRFLSNLDFSQPNYLHTNRQSLDSVKSSVNWSECLPCHKECENGCTGSTAKECTRCRHVKVYLDSGMNSWLCNHTCPEFNPYKIQDIRTGDIVCSNDPYKIHIVVVVSAYNDSQATRDYLTSTGTIPILVEQLTDNNSEAIYLIGQFLHNRYLSTEMADTTEIEHDASKDEKTSATCLMRCEKFWTQGQPRPTVVKKAKEERRRTRGRDNQSGRSKFSFKDKLLNTLEWNNNGSQIRGGGGGIKSMETKEKTMEVLNEEISPMLLSNTLKPNMATLRIITESELIRGPSIGSGAFGTVYCGVWCPKLSKSKIDTLNDACSTVTTATTANGASPSTPSAATAAGTPCLSTSFSYDVNKQTNDMESLSTSTDENYFNLHIPVAIKVLSDSADPQTNKELLEEAKVISFRGLLFS
ncbi:unnamed protein product [Trichobilharzia regenti]|nr:unnamed protein product [Trichobilharzia regenti]